VVAIARPSSRALKAIPLADIQTRRDSPWSLRGQSVFSVILVEIEGIINQSRLRGGGDRRSHQKVDQ
jgi:hypothetical protein